MIVQGTEAEASICNSNGQFRIVLDQGSTHILARDAGQATTKSV